MRSLDLTRALFSILRVGVAGATVGLVIGVGFRDTAAMVVSAVALAAIPLLWWLLQRGHTTAVAVAIIVLFNNLTVYALLAGGGIQDPTIMLFPVVVIASAVLLDRRLARAASALVVLSCVGVGVLEVTGAVETRLSHLLHISDVIFLSLLLSVAVALVGVLSRTVRESVRRAVDTDQSYLEIFNGTGEGIVVHDAESGQVVDANLAALDMFQVELRNLRLDVLLDEQHGFTRERFEGQLQQAARAPTSFEWCARPSNGRIVWLDVTLRSAQIQGRACVVSALRDISEQRELRAQVQQAEKLRALGLLARGVAHDFNNQLTGILANASLIEDAVDSGSRLKHFARSIVDCSQRSAELTKQLMAFARQGRQRSEVVDINAIVEDVRVFLTRSIDKRIEVSCVGSDDSAMVRGDPSFLQNAVLNLGLNARDAMPEGGTLRFAVETDPGSAADQAMVRIHVEDTGHGMTREVLDHIFEPFFTTRDEGNGMGLAAVYGTVDEHGGTIDVESKVGCGTKFTIALPKVGEEPAVQEGVEATATDRFRGTHVLLVEDEERVAEATQALLQRLGCQVTRCANGRQAVAEMARGVERFDVAVLDHSMPYMTGGQVLQVMRDRHYLLPVISTSGYAKGAVQSYEPVVFLAKPFNLQRMSQALGQALRTTQS